MNSAAAVRTSLIKLKCGPGGFPGEKSKMPFQPSGDTYAPLTLQSKIQIFRHLGRLVLGCIEADFSKKY